MAYIQIKDLSFSYPLSGKKALDGIDLEINKGEFICVCGASGGGKTTLLRQLKPALTPHGERHGEIKLAGKDVADYSLRQQSSMTGYVMQDIEAQLVTDKVWHELAFGLESLGCEQQMMRLRVAEMACYFGLQTLFHHKICTLSGGQKQLINLASVMVMQPELLILDEPTAQLDPISASDFIHTVSRLSREMGITVILSEHRLEELIPISDRVVVLDKGRIIADSTPQNIGAALRGTNRDMQEALPAPMRIWLNSDGVGNCPVTVREGRQWLEKKMNAFESVVTENEAYCEPDEPVIELKELYFRYEKGLPDVLHGLDLKVKKGTIHAIVGANGSGKSTMLKAICNEIKPYSGKILINGRNLEKYKPRELFGTVLSMLPQNPKTLFAKKTVREELEEMGGNIAQAIKLCGLEGVLEQHPYDLSGGEQQRAALAKVLLTKPQILLMDEPTKGMDAPFKRSFAALLKELCADGVTILLVSHDMEFCAAYADVVSLFFDGGIISTNCAKTFFSCNSFYTTSANRMSREFFPHAVTDEDVLFCLKKERGKRI